MTITELPEGFDFTDPDTMLVGVPLTEHALARQTSPVHWVEQPQSARDGMEGGTGYWAISRHEDILAVSKNSKNFSSAENSAIIRFPEGMLREMIEFQRVMLLNQDGAEHDATRKIISRGGSLYARTVLGIRVRDVTAGFICWRRTALDQLDLGTVRSNGYSFQIEMKYRAIRKGLRVVETPIVFVDRRVGQSKMSRAIFMEALGMVWKLRLGRV